MRIEDPRRRYLLDGEFRALVDSLLKLVEECQFTPFELRQALVLALTLYEERRAEPAILELYKQERGRRK